MRKGLCPRMKIDTIKSTARSAPARKGGRSRGATGQSFSDHLATEDAAPGAGVAAPPATAKVLLSLQEVPARTEKRRGPAEERGGRILDRLDELRLALLAGTLSRPALLDLARSVAGERGRIDDPRLGQVLDEIELRARVELAKYTAAG